MKATVLHSLNRIKRGLIVFVLLAICNPDILATVVHQDSYGIDYQLNYDTKEAQVIESWDKYDPHDIEPSGDIIIKDTINTINGGIFTVKYVGENAFADCKNITSVSLPKTIKSIEAKAFADCIGLTSITIPDSCHSIREHAFARCTGMKEIVIPNSVVNIERNAFWDCTLESVHITDLTSWCNIKFGNINSNPLFIGASLYLKGEKVIELIIPNSVTTINDFAFYGYSDLINITIPNSVTSINNYAFAKCTELTTVSMENSVRLIGEGCFSGCENLTNITLSNQLKHIEKAAFYFCERLRSIIIPSSVKGIDPLTFSGCSNLEYIKVGEDNAVYDSRGDCNAIIETNSNTLVRGCKSTIIPESVVNIGSAAFEGVLGLKKINIPQSVTSIGSSAFSNCSNLTNINLPNSLTEIQSSTFYYCQSLTDITIPENITNIGEYAFLNCNSLANIYCMSDLPPAIDNDYYCFDETIYSNARLWVPIGFKYQYQKANVWKNFDHISEHDMHSSSITEMNKTATTPTEIYDISGRPCTSMDKPGIYIIRMSDGSIRKIKK
ncbi:MAG: leucine-rich repeat protein [Bacteroidaceae bacterium]|nr:leucine-rich repeat protein [Bacteroidaceae bacterium]